MAILRPVIDLCPAAITLFRGPDHRFALANQAYCRLRMWSEAELLGRPVIEVIPEAAQDGRLATLDEVYRTGQEIRLHEHPWLERGGQQHYYDVHLLPFRSHAAAAVEGVLAIASDVTERVLARQQALAEREQATERLEADLQTVMDAVPAYILLSHDADGQALLGNRATNELLGLCRGLVPPRGGKPPSSRFFEDGVELADDQLPIQRAARGEELWGYELEIRPEGGPTRHLYGNAVPLVDRQNGVTGAVAAFIDVTERRQAEQQVAESEARYRALFESAPLSVIIFDVETGRMAQFNERAYRMHGYGRAEFARLTLDEMAVNPAAHRNSGAWRGLRGRARFETSHRRKDGSVLDLLVAAQAVPIGGRPHVYEMYLDITELKKTQRALADAKVEAERANQAKSVFLAAASHDLRQPLQALGLYLEVLKDRLEGQHAGLMKNVDRCLSSLCEFLDDLLDLSKLEAGVISPRPCPFPIADILDAVVTAHAPEAGRKGITLHLVGTTRWTVTDPVLFERIMSNLVSNAVRYTDKGGVVIGARRREGRTWVEVCDTGIGMAPEAIPEIFEEFKQLGNPERSRDKGTGLGLAIVRRTASLLGLEIRVTSQPGRGSIFAIGLPQAD